MPDSTLLRILCFLICEKTEARIPDTFSVINATNTLAAETVPCVAQFNVALALQGNPGDRGQSKHITLRVVDEDGKVIGATTGYFTFATDPVNPEPVYLGSFPVLGVRFPIFGHYQLEVVQEGVVLHSQYMRLILQSQTVRPTSRAERRRQERYRN